MILHCTEITLKVKITLDRAYQFKYKCDFSTEFYNMLTVMMLDVSCLKEEKHGLKQAQAYCSLPILFVDCFSSKQSRMKNLHNQVFPSTNVAIHI